MAKVRMPVPKMNLVTGMMSQSEGAGMGIEYSLDPSAVILVAEFNKLGMDIRSFKEPLQRSVKYMGPSFVENFTVSGRPEKWAALSDVTIEEKFQKGYARPSAPLIGTGLLMKTVGQQSIWKINGIEGYAAVDNLGAADYGVFHQEGHEGESIGVIKGKDKKGKAIIEAYESGGLPARPFLVFQPRDEKAIEDIFIKWFQERSIAAGFLPGVTGIGT